MKDDSPFEPGKEGIFLNLPEDVYRKAPGENISALKKLADSAKEYRYAIDHRIEPTPDMILGTVIHFLVLQKHRPESECFVTSPYPDFKTKLAQEWRDSQTLPIMTEKELTKARETARAILEHPRIGWILERKNGELVRAQTEVSAFRIHSRTGLLLKGRADIVFRDEENNTVLADLKKVQSVKPGLFGKDVGERGHWVSAAYYNDLFGTPFHYLIPAKVGPPADADIFQLKPQHIESGRAFSEKLLDRLVKCRALNQWPGVSENSETMLELDVPAWALKQAEEFVP